MRQHANQGAWGWGLTQRWPLGSGGFRCGWLALIAGIGSIILGVDGASGADGRSTTPADPRTLGPYSMAEMGQALGVAWVVLLGGFGLLVKVGFALAETGLARAKNASHTTALTLGTLAASVLGFWACGFALMFGGVGPLPTLDPASGLDAMGSFRLAGQTWDLVGLRGFFLAGAERFPAGALALFLLHAVIVDAAATIPTGAMLERWRFGPSLLFGGLAGAVIVPVYGAWVWGGGWLGDLGSTLGLGVGLVDFGGSGVIHLTGGVMALAGSLVLGPRIGKANPDGSSNPIPGHNVPMVIIGTLALLGGLLAIHLGRTLSPLDPRIAGIGPATLLAAGSGCLAALGVMRLGFVKPDPTMGCNGLLAGLVAIAAPCASVTPAAAVAIGVLAGLLVVGSILFLDKSLRIDDPVGAISVHGVCGAFGLLCVGLFANSSLESSGIGPQPVGFFASGTLNQLGAQAIGVLACLLWVGPTSLVGFVVIDRLVGNRVAAAAEIEGLDVPEMGVLGYVGEESYAVRTAGQDFLATFGPGVPIKSAPLARRPPVPPASDDLPRRPRRSRQ